MNPSGERGTSDIRGFVQQSRWQDVAQPTFVAVLKVPLMSPNRSNSIDATILLGVLKKILRAAGERPAII